MRYTKDWRVVKIQFTLDKDQCRSKYISSNKYVEKHTQAVAFCNFISIKLTVIFNLLYLFFFIVYYKHCLTHYVAKCWSCDIYKRILWCIWAKHQLLLSWFMQAFNLVWYYQIICNKNSQMFSACYVICTALFSH